MNVCLVICQIIPKKSKQAGAGALPSVWISIVLIGVFAAFTNQLDVGRFGG